MIPKQEYEQCDRESSDYSADSLLSDSGIECEVQKPPSSRAVRIGYMLSHLFAFALGLMVMAMAKPIRQPNTLSFFGLETNVPTPIPQDKRGLDDPLWEAPEIDFNAGFIAIDNDYAEKRGLPTAMYWPWDHSKSVYYVHAFHSMHCVLVLRDVIMQYHENKTQLWPHGHATHCLHVMREDVLCAADDTPRYMGRLHGQENDKVVTPGKGQVRMCRDWNKLYRNVIENSACYHVPMDHYIPPVERYKSCPDGSRPWEINTD